MITDPSAIPLHRRGWIGDGTRGALVSADGTIDWYCPQTLGGPAALWRLLDPAGGAIRVGPVREASGPAHKLPAATQGYRPGTNVLETVLDGPGATLVSVVDFLPWSGPGLSTQGRIVRLVRALSGPVDVEIEVYPSPRLTSNGPRRVGPNPGGSRALGFGSGQGVVFEGIEVATGTPFTAAPLGRDTERWRSVVHLDAGEETAVVIGPHGEGSPVTSEGAHRLLDETEQAWRSWIARLSDVGGYRPAVERSLLAIGSLTGLGGGPAAAGTASLPRRIGSERSHDDRWVNVDDVALAASVLAGSGLAEDAEAAEAWLRRAVHDAPRPWPTWLDPDGQPTPVMHELSLAGWRRAQPVRLGRRRDAEADFDSDPGAPGPTSPDRGAPDPAGPDPASPEPVAGGPTGGEAIDLGLFGRVVAAVGASTQGPGGRRGDPGPLSAAWPALQAAADYVSDHWGRPDAGAWGIAAPLRLHVSSRLDTWYGLDRMARLARAANPLDLDAPGWQQESRAIFDWLERDGVAPDGGLQLDGRPGASDEPDAALLSVTWRGPWPADHPVVVSTVDRVLERLGSGPFIYRYSDRVSDDTAGPDSPDLAATLRAVKALSYLGRWEEAHTRMEAVVGLGSGIGLWAETADPESGQMFGNLPCTSVGLALADAALALASGPR